MCHQGTDDCPKVDSDGNPIVTCYPNSIDTYKCLCPRTHEFDGPPHDYEAYYYEEFDTNDKLSCGLKCPDQLCGENESCTK